MKILINPFDTLFFRDGKPFSLGEETITNTILLPYPSTIYGAILSAYISQNNISLTEETLKNLEKKLKIIQIALYDEIAEHLLYPVPYDLVYEKEENYSDLYPLSLLNNVSSNIYFFKIPVFYKNQNVENFNGFVYQEDFKEYLSNNSDITHKLSTNEVISIEYKIGIGINNTINSVVEGNLYRIQLIRLRRDFFSEYENVRLKIFVELEGLDLEDNGYLKLGGENKVVYYEKLDKDPSEDIKNLVIQLDENSSEHLKFKLYLLTPAIFKTGYLAEWMNEKDFVKFKPKWCDKEIEIKLLSVATGKYLSIGGFDLKEKKLKSMKRAVPEGTIYYFETKEKDFNKIKKCFHLKSISDYEELRQKGFGIAFVGKYY